MPARLVVREVDGRSRVTESASAGPLRLVCPDTGAPSAWAYQSSLGGGFVGSDRLSLEVHVGRGATLFLSSQSSSKVYGATGARFELDVTVEEGATLVLWPEPTSCFAGAELTQQQKLRLAPGASVLCVDSLSSGRLARQERWDFSALRTSLTLSVGGIDAFHDALELNPRHGPLRERLGTVNVLSNVLLAGPKFEALAGRLHKDLSAEAAPTGEVRWVSSRWPWGVALRGSATTVEGLNQQLHHRLHAAVHQVLGDDPLRGKW